MLNSSFDQDSTFDLGSESDGHGFSVAEQLVQNENFGCSDLSDVSNSDDSETSSSDGEEVRELSESESDENSSTEPKASATAANLLFGIPFSQHISLMPSTFRKSYACSSGILEKAVCFHCYCMP